MFANTINASQNGINIFLDFADTTEAYYTVERGWDTLFDVSYDIIARGAMGEDVTLDAVVHYYGSYSKVINWFNKGKNSYIKYTHTPETYYAYIANRWY